MKSFKDIKYRSLIMAVTFTVLAILFLIYKDIAPYFYLYSSVFFAVTAKDYSNDRSRKFLFIAASAITFSCFIIYVAGAV